MIIHNVKQGTDEWKSLRVGIPTSSEFSNIIKANGEPSASWYKYMDRLVGERLSGIKVDIPQSYDIRMGVKREPEGRRVYAMDYETDVYEVGFCTPDHKMWGASPDFLENPKGGGEIKCPSFSVHKEYLKKKKVPSVYFHQVQGQMLVCEQDTWVFISYFPGAKLLKVDVEVNWRFRTNLKRALVAFCQELDEMTDEYRRKM